MLILPQTLDPDFVEGQEPPEYPVHTFTSDDGLEWRNIQSCVATGAELCLKWSKVSGESQDCQQCYPVPPDQQIASIPCQVLEWWKTTRGTFRGFEIEDNHPLWDRMSGYDECFRDLIEPYNIWRFKKRPRITTDVCGIYDVEIKLIQIAQCGTYVN